MKRGREGQRHEIMGKWKKKRIYPGLVSQALFLIRPLLLFPQPLLVCLRWCQVWPGAHVGREGTTKQRQDKGASMEGYRDRDGPGTKAVATIARVGLVPPSAAKHSHCNAGILAGLEGHLAAGSLPPHQAQRTRVALDRVLQAAVQS